jgi:hypothetical protein
VLLHRNQTIRVPQRRKGSLAPPERAVARRGSHQPGSHLPGARADRSSRRARASRAARAARRRPSSSANPRARPVPSPTPHRSCSPAARSRCRCAAACAAWCWIAAAAPSRAAARWLERWPSPAPPRSGHDRCVRPAFGTRKAFGPAGAPMRRRGKRGRPALGSAPANVESVRLDPELREQLLERAKTEGTTTSEVIQEALRRFPAGRVTRGPWAAARRRSLR